MLKRLTIPSLLIMLSSGAHALTLGQIHVHSFINQPLKATIDLQGVKADELSALKIKLASRSDFKNAGVDWSAKLEGLSFSIIQSNKGPAIRVTSRKAVVEPFLSFVVDAKWANGKMIKDFTLLLDPPLYSGKKAAAVDAASVTARTPVQTDDKKPQPQKQKVLPAAPEEEAAATSPASDIQGPVAQTMTGTSLWQVASKVRPTDATMQQTMVAIHEENPESFLRGNMNLLKKGQLLRIPSAEVIQGISGGAAVKRVAKHEQALRARKSVRSSKRLSPEIIALAAEPAAPPAQQTAVVTPPEAGVGGQLRLDSAADAVNEGAFGGDLESGKSGLSADTGEVDENRALKSRVALLEEQLRVAHKLIKMKGELAQLQGLYRQIDTQRSKDDDEQLDVTDEQLLLLADAGSVAAEEAVAEESAQELLSADDADMKDEDLADDNPEQQQTSAETDTSEDVEPSRGEADQPSPVATDDVDTVAGEETQAEDASSSPPAAEEQQTGSPATETEAVVASTEMSTAPSTEILHEEAAAVPGGGRDSIIEGIENNLLLTAGGVGVLGLLLSFLLGRGSKKRTGPDQGLSDEIPLDESLTEKRLAGVSSDTLQEGEVESVGEVSDADETLIQQPNQESTKLFEPPEVFSIEEPVALDPLQLVKVLLRNGENQQAQEVLMQAVDADPARMELHMQLIELLHANKDRRAFEAEMNQLETSGFNIDPEDWQNIEGMHADLLPSVVDSPDVVSRKHSDAEIIDLDFGAVEKSSGEDVAGSGGQSDSDLEEALRAFEMVLEDKNSDELLSEAGIALDETAAILDNPVTNAMPGSEIVEDLELEEDLVVDENAAADQEIDIISLDDSFGIDSHINDDFNDIFSGSANQTVEESDALSPGEEDALPIAESEELSITSFDTDPSTLKQAELDAKIDLAAAFADMGDVDGAKDILDEVLSEGSAHQQRAVQELLKKYL